MTGGMGFAASAGSTAFEGGSHAGQSMRQPTLIRTQPVHSCSGIEWTGISTVSLFAPHCEQVKKPRSKPTGLPLPAKRLPCIYLKTCAAVADNSLPRDWPNASPAWANASAAGFTLTRRSVTPRSESVAVSAIVAFGM